MDNMQTQEKLRMEARTSGLAIASLILGILGFCTFGLAGIAGLILGIVGLIAISKSAGQLKGGGLAIAGIIVSAISLITLFIVLLMAILMPALAQARHQARTAVSLNNVKQLCLATLLYCDDNEQRFPPCDNWPDVLKSYYHEPKLLTSPHVPHAVRSYAMNAKLNGRRISDISERGQTVLFFEARSGSAPDGGRELLPDEPRGPRGYIIGFVDGHVECVPPERLDELIWEP
jgi:prepilin-type processing-associated H-X9-DG protein